ncbi:MAG: hypothetical protein ACFCUP_15355 [Actinomycetales bacterium]
MAHRAGIRVGRRRPRPRRRRSRPHDLPPAIRCPVVGDHGRLSGRFPDGRGRLLGDGLADAALAALLDRFPVRLRAFLAIARAPWTFVEVSRA